MPDDTTYPWVGLSAEADNVDASGYSKLTAVKITYTSSDSLYLSLTQTGLSDNGEAYMVSLPPSATARTVTLAIDTSTFHQPDWVETASKLDLTRVTGIDFTPGVETSTTATISGSFTITECALYGITVTATRMAAATVRKNELTARFSQGNLVVAGLCGDARISVFAISGRRVFSTEHSSAAGNAVIRLPMATQTLLVQVKSASGTANFRIPAGIRGE